MSSPFPNTPLVCVTLSIHLGIPCVPPLSPQTLRLSSAPSFPGFIPWTLLCHCPLMPPACWSSMPGPSCAFPVELLCVCVCVSENVCVLVLLWLLPIGLRECCVHHHHGSQQTKVAKTETSPSDKLNAFPLCKQLATFESHQFYKEQFSRPNWSLCKPRAAKICPLSSSQTNLWHPPKRSAHSMFNMTQSCGLLHFKKKLNPSLLQLS